MKKFFTLIVFISLSFSANAQFGSFPPFTKWYQNPLGFSPLNLHTSMGIIVPGVIAGTLLLATKKDTGIAKKFTYFNENGLSVSYNGAQTLVYQNNTGILYHARKWMALGAEITCYYARDEVNNTPGFGLRPFIRFYPLHKGSVRLFFESGAGLICFVNQFPQPSGIWGDMRMGTRLNGSPKYGIGAEFNIDKRLAIQLGIRHVHISNGNSKGVARNPGHDSNGFSIGFQYRP